MMSWLRLLRVWFAPTGRAGEPDPRPLRERVAVFIGFRKDW
jgi:hypothetical protein